MRHSGMLLHNKHPVMASAPVAGKGLMRIRTLCIMVLGGMTSSTADVRFWILRRQQSLHVEMPNNNLSAVGIPIDEPRHQQDQTQR